MATITAAMVKDLREMTGAAMMDCKKALDETSGDMEAAKEFLRKKGQASADKKSSRETKEGAIAVYSDGAKAGLVKLACETDFVAINDSFQAFVGSLAQKASAGVQSTEGFAESVKSDLVGAIAKMGENMVVLQAEGWKTQSGVIGTYIHGKGKIGVLVELSLGGANKAKAIEVAKEIAMHIAACQVEAVSEKDLDPKVLEKEKAFLIDQAKDSGKPMEILEKMVEGRLKKFKKEICLMDQNFVKEPDKSVAAWLEGQSKTAGGTLSVVRFLKSSF